MKMWSGRFSQALDPDFEKWQRSFPFDQRLVQQEAAASKEHAAALHRAGVLSNDELKSVVSGIDRIVAEGVPASDDKDIEDVHHFLEKRLTEIAGETGRKLHTGRSRNEQIATDLRLWVRDRIDETTDLLAEAIGALLDQAMNAGMAAMPSYTHLQRAEPVLVAHWLLAYAEMFFRDAGRLADCRTRLNQCPLGSGAIAGTFVPLDRKAIAEGLGFDAPTANSMDATSDRDFAIEFVQGASMIGMHLSRLAEEMLLFSTKEYGFVQLPEQYSTGSSAMPQKKNPDAMELIRGKSAGLIGQAVTLLVTMKALPLAYNKDLQETQHPIYAAAEQCAEMLRITAGFLRSVTFNLEVMHEAATTGYMNAMSGAGYLTTKGVPFRRAHEQIGAAVRAAIDEGCELEQLSAEKLQQCGIQADVGFYNSLSLDSVLKSHDVDGGTAPTRVASALRAARERLAAMQGASHAYA